MDDCEHDIVADATGVGYLCRRCGYEPDYELNDRSDAGDATFRAVADRIEAAPEAAEAWACVCGHDGLPEQWHADHCTGRAGNRERAAELLWGACWDSVPLAPEDERRVAPLADALDAAEQRGAERVAQRMRELAEEPLRDALRIHHPIMRSETGPFSGCRCGQVRLGQDVIAHVVGELRAALADVAPPTARREGQR